MEEECNCVRCLLARAIATAMMEEIQPEALLDIFVEVMNDLVVNTRITRVNEEQMAELAGGPDETLH